MLIREFRIPMPLTLEEYEIGMLYSVAEFSRRETKNGEGVEFITNESFSGYPLFNNMYDTGTHTYKIYRLANKMPSFIKLLFGPNTMDVHEESWNAFPYCRTVLTNPGYMKENFSLTIETMHECGMLENENAHLLPPEELGKRTVVTIDIGNDPFTKGEFERGNDPSGFVSVKTKRGPLKDDWMRNCDPIMTCYKLVRAEFKWFGLQSRVESYILDVEQKLFLRFHRYLFCWIDDWHGLDIEQIRRKEDEVTGQLHIAMSRHFMEEEKEEEGSPSH